MDLHQLRAFIEVAREGNLTRASQVLCLSQPAVSTKIKALEDEIGLKLFERSAHGMKLTHHGEILREEASRTLAAAHSFLSRAKGVNRTLPGAIRVGTIGEPIALQFGEFLSNLLVAAPDVTVSITQGISGEIIERVLAGTLDAGFVIGRPAEQQLEVIALAPVTFVIAAPAAWQDRVESSSWPQLAELPWIGTPRKCSLNGIAAALFARNGVEPKRAAEADQDNLLRSMVARGFGLSILRQDQALAAQKAGEVVIWPHDAAHSELCFIARSDSMLSPVNEIMVDMLGATWRSAGALA
ncbi:MAG: transcriptional regulator, LysR family [Massilia sp.]|nr:transcriptional regulator, LysR family [Massilia sp.]